MKSFKELLLTKPKKYRVTAKRGALCKDEPYSVIEIDKRVVVSHTVGYYANGKILKGYDVFNGSVRISRFRKRWVKLSELTEI